MQTQRSLERLCCLPPVSWGHWVSLCRDNLDRVELAPPGSCPGSAPDPVKWGCGVQTFLPVPCRALCSHRSGAGKQKAASTSLMTR